MTIETGPVLVDRPEGGVALVRLNRPGAKNARKAVAAGFESRARTCQPEVRVGIMPGVSAT